MRVYMPSIEPQVYLDPEANRSIILKLRSLRIAMTPDEALTLADMLVDSSERTSHE